MALVSHEKIHFPFSAAFPSRLRPVEPRCAGGGLSSREKCSTGNGVWLF